MNAKLTGPRRHARPAPYRIVRWDPTRENILFLNQSANLYANYYQLQIAVHRPFIPSPRKPSPLSFPSLAICTNAARSCVHVTHVVYTRTGDPHWQNMVGPVSFLALFALTWPNVGHGASLEPYPNA